VKGLGGILVYVLLIIGAVAMLMPFAWMVVTSIKLPGEVEQWPPKWGTKNFLSKREVKIEKDYSGDSLTLVVNDDAFLRGKVHILFESTPSYSYDIPEGKFHAIYENYKDLFSKKPADFKSTGDFVTYQLKTLENYLSKTAFYDTVISNVTKSLNALKTVSKMVNIRVSDEEDKNNLSSYIHKLQGALAELKVKSEGIYDSMALFLSKSDVNEILKIFSEFKKGAGSTPALNTRQAKLLLNFIEAKVLKPVESSFAPYHAYVDVLDALVKVQDDRFEENEIVARFKTKSEKYDSLKNYLSKDYPWIWSSIEKRAKKSPDSLWTTIDALLEEKKNSKNEEILKEIENSLISSEVETLAVFRDVENLVKKCLDVSYGKNINFEDYINYGNIMEFVNRYTDGVVKIAENMEEYKEFYKMEGLKTSLNAIKSIAERLQKNLKVDPMNFVRKIYYMDKEYRKEYNDVRERYINAVDTMVILENPAPEIVKSVKTHIMKGKDMTKQTIAVDFSVHSINFYDDRIRVAVFFNFGEIVKNIFQNYVDAWHAAPFGRYYANTVFVATATTVLEVILASMAAFAFAILSFPEGLLCLKYRKRQRAVWDLWSLIHRRDFQTLDRNIRCQQSFQEGFLYTL